MDNSELIRIYKLLRDTEEKLLELHRGLRVTVNILHNNPDFAMQYEQNYGAPGSSEVCLGYVEMRKAIDDALARLEGSVHDQ